MPVAQVGSFQIICWSAKGRVKIVDGKRIATEEDDPRDSAGLRYIASVKAELEKIGQSQSGRALLSAIAFHKQTVSIMKPPEKVCNAAEQKLDNFPSVVWYNPNDLRECFARSSPGDTSSRLPNEILHHELVHALRRISGKLDPKEFPGWVDNEEFLAVALTDIYASDVTNKFKSSLRGSYPGHARLDDQYSTSLSFFLVDQRAFHIIANFCSENRGYASLLKDVRARFNPVEAMITRRKECQEMAFKAHESEFWEKLEFQRLLTITDVNDALRKLHPAAP